MLMIFDFPILFSPRALSDSSVRYRRFCKESLQLLGVKVIETRSAEIDAEDRKIWGFKSD